MDSESPPKTVIEVNLGAEPIDGCVILPSGRREPFSGYLGLLALLHRLQPRDPKDQGGGS